MRVILTIDCDFVYDKLLDTINDMVLSRHRSMEEFVRTLEKLPYYKMYRDFLIPNNDKVHYLNKIIDKHLHRRKNVIVIKEHHEILRHIDSEGDIVFNLDYHEDMDEDESELFCGNWANNIKTYYWSNEADPTILDMDYDLIVICYSPEWTPSVKFIENLSIRKKLEDLVKI